MIKKYTSQSNTHLCHQLLLLLLIHGPIVQLLPHKGLVVTLSPDFAHLSEGTSANCFNVVILIHDIEDQSIFMFTSHFE